MATFKCKMCGGSIEAIEGKSTCECEYCGSLQTVPLIYDNVKLTSLHNRANALRIKCEFDKALLTYETIISENNNDAEAHFGAVLCKYGIEYVNEENTNKKIPTCHRTIKKSIFDDYDYLEAIKYADVYAKKIYTDEAKAIDAIQKKIISISLNEQAYDIFICYKETDNNGQRSIDSVIAQDIYNELIKIGYKVFFSRITLESKLGYEYEPIIYSALRSSKVMLVIGSNIDNFNAVWVKNEWNRFLSFMLEENSNKFIIPCFKNMDAYELPEELLAYQSIDLNKIGFMQDLIHGIEKLFGEKTIKNKIINSDIAFNIDKIFQRVQIFLDDKDKEEARVKLDLILDNDPENVKAYLYLAILDFDIYRLEDISNIEKSLNDNKYFQKAYKYASNEEKIELDNYIKIVNDNIKRIDNIKKYKEALNLFEQKNYSLALEIFESIKDYSDSYDYIIACEKIINAYKEEKYLEALNLFDSHAYNKCIDIFKSLNDYKNSLFYLEESERLEKIEEAYLEYRSSIIFFNKNKKKFNDLINDYKTKYGNDIEIEYKEKIKITNKIKLSILLDGLILPIILLTCFCIIISHTPLLEEYKTASVYFENGEYETAQLIFDSLDEMGDSKKMNNLMLAYEALNAGYYEEGIEYLSDINANMTVNFSGNGGSPINKTIDCDNLDDIYDVKFSMYKYTFLRYELTDFSIEYKNGKVKANISLKAIWLERSISSNNCVYIGSFPDSVVEDEEVLEELNKLYGEFEDGYYFYKGNKYYKYTVNLDTSSKYNNGKTITNGTNWFLVNPITWMLLNNDDGYATFTTLNSVCTRQYSFDSSNSTMYSISDIHDWLVNEFYNEAFLRSEKELILQNYKLDENENHSVWLFSSEEIDLETKIFDYEYQKRLCLTDYSYATGGTYEVNNLSGSWWLRSDDDKVNAKMYNSDGTVIEERMTKYALIRPGIYLNVNKLSKLSNYTIENPKKNINQ